MYGVAGSIAFATIFILSPLVVVKINSETWKDPAHRAAMKGLALYAFVMFSDGTFNYPPLTVFYWFTYMIFSLGCHMAH